MTQLQEIYFRTPAEWREWLEKNHSRTKGVYLIFYKVASNKPSMRWEEAVKVALCFGWIDSTVKKIDHERRRQYFCPRKAKSVWSKLNKSYIDQLDADGLLHASGQEIINRAKQNGSWTALDAVEDGIIPEDLLQAFENNPQAFENYSKFAPSYKKSYLYWLNQAKRTETRKKRISEIISLCRNNLKTRA